MNLVLTSFLPHFSRRKHVDLSGETLPQTRPAGIPGLSYSRHLQVGKFTFGSFLTSEEVGLGGK